MNLITLLRKLPFLISALAGIILILAVNLFEKTSIKINHGKQAQLAIQTLDEIRRPILSLKKAEYLKLSVKEQHATFLKAVETANTLIKQYQTQATYNPELLIMVNKLSEELNKLILNEQQHWQIVLNLSSISREDIKATANNASHQQTTSQFFHVLDILALGEHPLHIDIAEGQAASNLLNWSSVSLVIYLLLLIIVFQNKRSTELNNQQSSLEKQVAERTHSLEITNNELEAFAYSVSHDLRAPLRSIDGFSQVLIDDCSDKLNNQDRDYLHRIRLASQKMEQLIEGLLQLSRITRNPIKKQNLDLESIAQTIVYELRESSPDRDVTVHITENLHTVADESLANIALTNLFSNAWKYTANKPNAVIEFGITEGTDEFYIKDNGIGFNNDYKGKLFNPFQRLHGKEFKGNGIGLATVKRIIDRHGGNIRANAKENEGSTFYFSFGEL